MVENREDIETQNLEEFRNLIAEKKYTALREKAKDMNDSDLAYIMDNMEDEDMLTMFRLFPKELAADVFSQLTLESQQYIITSLSEKKPAVLSITFSPMMRLTCLKKCQPML